MDVHEQEPPAPGTYVEMVRSRGYWGGSFERAVVVNRVSDPGVGFVLEVQFEDDVCVQRVWPSPAIRLLN